jgi:hypothetical protein
VAPLFVALGASVLSALPVGGSALCPAPREVQAALESLLPQGGRPGDAAEINSVGGGLEVTLHDARGTLIAHRVFAERTGCDTLAQAAALLIAAWEAETPPGTRPDAPSKLAETEAEGANADATSRAEADARAGDALGVASSRDPSGGWPIEVGGGAVASWADALAVGGLLDVAAGPPGRWAGVASFEGTTARSLPLGGGAINWQRWQLGLGARLRLTQAPELAAQAEAVGAAVALASSGFQTDGSAIQVEPGGRLTLRASIHLGPVIGWLEVAGTAWFLRQLGVVQDVASTAQLPRYEVLAAAGVAVGR